MDTRTSEGGRTGPGHVGRVVIIGDSHIHAIKDALAQRPPAGTATPIEAYRLLKVKQTGGPAVGNQRSARHRLVESGRRLLGGGRTAAVFGDISTEQALRLARRLGPQDVLVSVIGGNQHAVFSTIQHPQPFDFALTEDDGGELPAPGSELVPFAALYPYFRIALRDGDGETIAAFRKATSARMIHLLAPPPKRLNEWIEQHHDTLFIAEGLAEQGVSRPELRLKFWRLQNRAVEEICADLAVEVLGPPSESFDDESFLARPFYAGDATHANPRYGELVLQQLEAMLSASPEAVS